MIAPASASPSPDPRHTISLRGRFRIAARLTAMFASLLACIPLYYIWHLSRARHNPWPRRFLGGIARLAGIHVTVRGKLPHKGAILLANHVSWIDIPAMAGATGTAFVAHDGLASVPLLHWLCKMNDTVFIARHDRKSVAKQVTQVREAIRDTGALAIFPEGTTADGTRLLPFKSSLLSALDPLPPGVAVQPVWLDYGAEAPQIAWVGDEPGLANFLRILARPHPLCLRLHLLLPLKGEALTHRKTMAAAARAAIEREMRKMA